MSKLIRFLFVASLCSLFVVIGCTKKTTQIEAIPEIEAPPPPPPPQEEVFQPTDLSDELKALLVPIYFEYDKYTLRPDALASLEKIAPFLSQNTSVRILLEGHADERGTDEYNMGLSENRSKAVRDYLGKYGIAANRIEMVAYGRTKPANAYCQDEACHSLNRRVEWQVLAQ